MKNIIPMTLILAMVAFASLVRAEVQKFSKIIPGYALNEYAIKGEQEQHLLDINTEIEEKKALFPNHRLVISLAGRGDRQGPMPETDKVGTRRAENAEGFLKDKQPNAQTNVWSEGEKKDAREVLVQYWFEPIEPTKTIVTQSVLPQAESGSGWKIVIAVFVLGTGIMGALIVRRTRKQQPNVKEYTREACGKMHVFPVKIRADGLFEIPIKYVRDGKPVIKPTWHHVKTAISGFLKDPAYAEQIRKFEQSNN